MARKVARNALYNFSALLVGNISGLFLTIILARILKPENFGIYSLALSIAMLAIAFSNLGIDGAVVRYTAFYIGRGDLKKVRGHLHYFFKIKFVLASIIAAILIIFAKELASVFKDERLAVSFMIVGGIVFFASIVSLFNAFFVGLQKFKYVFLRQSIYETSRWAFCLPLAMVFLASGALIGISVAYMVVCLFLGLIIIKRYGEFVRGEVSPPDKSSRKFMGFMTVAGVSGIIYAYVDSVMIGYFMTSTDVGYYRAAYTVVFAIVGLVSSVSGVLFPTFTQMGNEDINTALERLIRYTSVIVFPFSLSIFYLSEEIVKVIYGVDYLAAVQAMVILSFALIPGAFTYLGTIFGARERADISACIQTFSMTLNVILNYFLILRMGIAGAALATVISRFFMISIVVFLLYRIFSIRPNFKVSLKPILASIVMLLVLIILPKPISLIFGLVEISFAGIIYMVIIFSTKSLSLDDIRYLRDVFR